MGGAVSSGRDNNELIDNLMSGNYIRTRQVEAVFRALDRADYMTPEARDQAYKDLAWRNGPLHLSSPCIYSEVMEGLELRPGLSFLNVGSGTGYLSSLVGLILGTSGISHGVEVHPTVFEYATKKISQFIENSPTLDEFDFCEPKYYHGNGLCLSPPQSGYDRVYCGAACPVEYEMYFKQLIKVGGVLVMPLNDTLLQVRRVGPAQWVSRSLLNVSFATLRVPAADEATTLVKLDPLRPVRLQLLSRAVVRSCMRGGVLRRHPELQQGQRPAPPAACPRRICIPIEPGGSVEGLNVLHDLDSESGTRVGGVLVMPLNDTLLQVRRVGSAQWVSRSLLNVSFATLRVPAADEATTLVKLDPLRPVRLQLLSRAVVRSCMRGGVLRRHPELQQGQRPAPPAACPRRICIPIEPGGSVEGLNVLHDLDSESGANEMNALLSLVISMGQNRVAGALRFDRVDSDSSNDENGADEPEIDQAEAGPDDLPEDQPKDIDLPVSDSEEKSIANADASDLEDTRPAPRSRLLDEFEHRTGQSHHNGPRRRPRPPGDSSDDKPPPANALRELVRKRRDARPSTSTSQTRTTMAEVLTNTEEMAKKETVVENEEKTDNMTGPPKRELPGVPSVVEIDLGEASDMEWDPEYAEALDAAVRRLAQSDGGEDEALKNGPKRQKLDSGIGEETPDGSSPEKSKGEESDVERSDDGPIAEGEDGVVERSWSPGPEEIAHAVRRRRREARGGDARRVRLSLLMKQAVRELPLPHALKKFVNLGRCFEF